jgi:hypothetical protein
LALAPLSKARGLLHRIRRSLWLVTFPFRAYVVIAAALLVAGVLPASRPRHSWPTEFEMHLILSLGACGGILIAAAAVFAYARLPDLAKACGLFGVAGLAISLLAVWQTLAT